MRVRVHLYLLQHVLQLNQELLGVFGFVGDAVEGLRQLDLRRSTRGKDSSSRKNQRATCKTTPVILRSY